MLKRQKLYKKDGLGNTFMTGVSCYQGRVFTHFPKVYTLCHILDELMQSVPREDDVWIMSYPKSGILLSGKLEPLKIFKGTTFIDVQPDFKKIDAMQSPRVINTHARVKYLPSSILHQSKIILMIRNPKSVAVSYYHHMHGIKHYKYSGSFDGFYEAYMDGIDDFCGTWFEYVTEWWDAAKGKHNIHIVFYEHLKKNPIETIQDIAEFLGVKRDETFCQKVVKLTAFDQMKSEIGKSPEAIQFNNSFWKDGKQNICREGIIKDWKNYFTQEQNQHFHKIYVEKMKRFGDMTSQIQYE